MDHKEQERGAAARDALAARLLPSIKDSPLRLGCASAFPSSRWQLAPAYGAETWVKREDELSFGMSGSKWRKMLSLSQAIEQGSYRSLVAWGSSRSQFILGLLQVAAERGLRIELFLLRAQPWQGSGTDQLWALLSRRATIHWVERESWSEVGAMAASLAARQNSLLIGEGAAQIEALPGAMSLALDIGQQEARLGLGLQHIVVDAGSGFTAQALFCGLAYLGHQAALHLVLCAGSEASFRQGLDDVKEMCAQLWGSPPPPGPRLFIHTPVTARSYGATNAAVWSEMRRRAWDSGLLLDPLYMAKLSATFRALDEQGALEGQRLLVHSGGGLNLFAFLHAWGEANPDDRPPLSH